MRDNSRNQEIFSVGTWCNFIHLSVSDMGPFMPVVPGSSLKKVIKAPSPSPRVCSVSVNKNSERSDRMAGVFDDAEAARCKRAAGAGFEIMNDFPLFPRHRTADGRIDRHHPEERRHYPINLYDVLQIPEHLFTTNGVINPVIIVKAFYAQLKFRNAFINLVMKDSQLT